MPHSAMFKAASLAITLSAFLSTTAIADSPRPVNIPASDLTTALELLEKQSGMEIIYRPELLRGLRTEGVTGTLSSEDAVSILLKGTRLKLQSDQSGVLLITEEVGASGVAAASAEKRASAKPVNQSASTNHLQSAGTDSATPMVSNPTSLSQVTVEGHLLEEKARSFVMNVTGASGFFMDAPVQLWRRPICPYVAGLPRQEGQFAFDHLEAVLTSIGVPRGKVGCHPNFFFIVTAEPESVLNGAWKRNWHLFGDASPSIVKQFIRTPRPVRVWYNNILSGEDSPAAGAAHIPALMNDPLLAESLFGAIPSIEHDGNGVRARFVAFNDLLAVVAIVDPTKLQGVDWTQVVEYVVIAGLTRVDPDVDLGDTPSILHLFTAAAGARPAGLSEWDRFFLKELYGTDPTLRSQRFEVSHRMVSDLQRASRE